MCFVWVILFFTTSQDNDQTTTRQIHHQYKVKGSCWCGKYKVQNAQPARQYKLQYNTKWNSLVRNGKTLPSNPRWQTWPCDKRQKYEHCSTLLCLVFVFIWCEKSVSITSIWRHFVCFGHVHSEKRFNFRVSFPVCANIRTFLNSRIMINSSLKIYQCPRNVHWAVVFLKI